MSGLTTEGLMIQRLSDILVSQREKAALLFRDITPIGEEVDTSENTTIGRLIALAAPSCADLWEALQEVDSAFDPEKATGVALDKIAMYGAISRKDASSASVKAQVVGNNGVVIPAASMVRATSNNTLWKTRTGVILNTVSCAGVIIDVTTITNSAAYSITYTSAAGTSTLTYTSDGSATKAEIQAGLTAALSSPHLGVITSTLDSGGFININLVDPDVPSTITVTSNLTITKVKATVEMLADVTGVLEQPINTVTSIATPILNWDSVTNITAAVGGSAKETDEELRLRFRNTKYERASNILESLYSALLALEGTTEVIIYENDTVTTDANGVPPHSFMAVIAGSSSTSEIGKTIWENKPLGIQAYGDITTPVLDSQNFSHDISFKRPADVRIYITMDVDKGTTGTPINGVYPADGDAQIKQALYDYFKANIGIHDNVVQNRLFTPINSVVGHQVNTLFIGTSASPTTTTTITIGAAEVASLDIADIIIT